jgi:nickel/cobalt transporter (NicO) family protein
MELMSLSALSLGFLHGLGGDHLMAIAALAVRRSGGSQTSVVRTAIGFACGHALVLGVGAVVAVALGVVMPVAVSAGAERVGGALLVALGAAGVWGVLSGRAYGHIHRDGTRPSRWHMHLGWAHPAGGHSASPVPAALGAIFAVSSLRALMLLQPFGEGAQALSLPALLFLVLLFGLGILASMSVFGLLLARVLSIRTVERFGRAAAVIVAVGSVALGAYWILG